MSIEKEEKEEMEELDCSSEHNEYFRIRGALTFALYTLGARAGEGMGPTLQEGLMGCSSTDKFTMARKSGGHNAAIRICLKTNILSIDLEAQLSCCIIEGMGCTANIHATN